MTKLELLKKYLEEEKQKVHDASADFDHEIPKKGKEQEYEDAVLGMSLLEEIIKDLEGKD